MVPLARRASLALAIALTALCAAAPANAEPVLTQDFEDGLDAWTANGFWHVQENPQAVSVRSPEINPGLVTIPSGQLPAAFSGTRAAWFGEESTGTFCGPGWSVAQEPKSGCRSTTAYSGHLSSPSFSLVGALSAILRFRSWWEIEGVNADAYDLMEVEYSTDGGGTWSPAGKLNPADNPASEHDQSYSNNGLMAEPGWKNYLVDLSPAIGSPDVRIRFAFDTDDNLYNGFRGWLVDDVVVSTPFDADAPVIADVDTCDGLKPAAIWVAHGTNFVQGSQILLDGAPAPGANMPAPDRIEMDAGNAGAHTLQLVSPNGTESNPFPFGAGNCAETPGPSGPSGPDNPSGAEKRPSTIQVFCNYVVLSETDTCTATVADATGGGRVPTGTVRFSSASGGAFLFGDACTLKKAELSTVSSCSVQFKRAKGKPLAVSGEYSGDDGLLGTKGETQFLQASPGNGAYLDTIQPFQPFGAEKGPQTLLTVTVDNPVGGTTIEGDASLSANGSICDSGMGPSATSSLAASSGTLAGTASVVAFASKAGAKGKGKGKSKSKGKGKSKRKRKGKGKRRKRLTVPGWRYRKPKTRRVRALVVSKTKRNAKAGKVKLRLKFNRRKLIRMFGKRKRLKLVVRVTLSNEAGQPAVVYRELTLKKKGKGKVRKGKGRGRKGKRRGKRGGARRSAAAAGFEVVAHPSQSGTIHSWRGANDCSALQINAQFDQGDQAAPLVAFGWSGEMLCLDGSTVPFHVSSPAPIRGTIAGTGQNESVDYSFAAFSNPGYTLQGRLFGGSAVAQGEIGGQAGANACRAMAPTTLTQFR